MIETVEMDGMYAKIRTVIALQVSGETLGVLALPMDGQDHAHTYTLRAIPSATSKEIVSLTHLALNKIASLEQQNNKKLSLLVRVGSFAPTQTPGIDRVELYGQLRDLFKGLLTSTETITDTFQDVGLLCGGSHTDSDYKAFDTYIQGLDGRGNTQPQMTFTSRAQRRAVFYAQLLSQMENSDRETYLALRKSGMGDAQALELYLPQYLANMEGAKLVKVLDPSKALKESEIPAKKHDCEDYIRLLAEGIPKDLAIKSAQVAFTRVVKR